MGKGAVGSRLGRVSGKPPTARGTAPKVFRTVAGMVRRRGGPVPLTKVPGPAGAPTLRVEPRRRVRALPETSGPSIASNHVGGDVRLLGRHPHLFLRN